MRIKTLISIVLLFISIAASAAVIDRTNKQSNGFYISTSGDLINSRIAATKCLQSTITKVTPLVPANWKNSVLDISIIVMDSKFGNKIVSIALMPAGYPAHHSLITIAGIEDQNKIGHLICIKTAQYLEVVLKDLLE